jgi:radical SAM enzyme (TIGR01210 family)
VRPKRFSSDPGTRGRSTSDLVDRFVLEHRGPKNALDSENAYASMWEEERGATGALVPTAVVFLTNRECPFHCVMCDLWKNTLDETVERGAIPRQIRRSLASLPPVTQVKLYNAGSFFDPQAIPAQDDEEIAAVVRGCDRVIVESHPAFLAGVYAERCLRFRDRLDGRLEVAIGLETAHEGVLARLNKHMTLESFRRAAEFLRQDDIALRVFILLSPPFMRAEEDVEWACRSIDEAVACGASVCSIIPTRSGNGALEALGDAYHRPALTDLERVIEYGLSTSIRVFADLWDVEQFYTYDCSPLRTTRLRTMNREQHIAAARVQCECDGRSVRL